MEKMSDKVKIWIDIKNSHEPLLFKSLMKDLPYEFYITARDYAEVTSLLDKYGIRYRIVGKFHTRNKFLKMLYLIWRSFRLALTVPRYDFFLSHGSFYGVAANLLRRQPSITITDNDFITYINKFLYSKSTYLVVPLFLDYKSFKINNLITFDGFKEDLYLADFEPKNCREELPFNEGEYIIIRPEAYKTYYVSMSQSIVQNIIALLQRENVKVVLSPRYSEEKDRYGKIPGIYVLSKPVNGLCAAWNARAVLTGAGTWAREAACMGVPAVSFFPGEKLLSVDAELIKRGWLYHSRDPEEIVEYVLSAKRNNRSLERSKKVKEEVIKIIRGIVEEGI